MIISASRRTDIPAFFSEWFVNRLRAGHVMVRNPANRHQVSKISLRRDVVDCIVFWTKNPKEMLDRLCLLDRMRYEYYFQFTLNPYGKDIEANVPVKTELTETFRKLSDRIGKNKVIWRYDPIMLTDTITTDDHIEHFRYLADKLHRYTNKCVISFMDFYKKCRQHLKAVNATEISYDTMRYLSESFHDIARSYGLALETCAEDIELSDIGIPHGKCVDDKLIGEIRGGEIRAEKDKTQRTACGCVTSVDIGDYDTCRHFCRYCYANSAPEIVERNVLSHNPDSPLLIGEPKDTDTVCERKPKRRMKEDTLFGTPLI